MGPGYKAREQGAGGGGSPGVPASAALVGQAGVAEHNLFFHWAKLLLDVMLN